MECEHAYVPVYVLALAFAAIVSAMHELESWKERFGVIVLMTPGVGLVVYSVAVMTGLESFRHKVVRIIILVELVMLAMISGVYGLSKNCSTHSLLVASARALLTHLALFRFF